MTTPIDNISLSMVERRQVTAVAGRIRLDETLIAVGEELQSERVLASSLGNSGMGILRKRILVFCVVLSGVGRFDVGHGQSLACGILVGCSAMDNGLDRQDGILVWEIVLC
jgi:hypothetical protein